MSPPPMPVATALYAALVGVLLLLLGALVSRKRRRFQVGLGDGGNKELARAIRAHANSVEWAVPGILLLLVAELTRAGPLIVHACGIAIVAGRVLHAIGLSGREGYSFGRFAGSVLSWGAMAVLVVWNLWAFARLALV